MLTPGTWIGEYAGMALALWLAAYLVGRGASGTVTRLAALVLLTVALGFGLLLAAEETGSPRLFSAWNAALSAAVVGWYWLTLFLIGPDGRRRQRWLTALITGLGALKVVVLGVEALSAAPTGNPADMAPGLAGAYATGDLMFLLLAASGCLINFRLGSRTGHATLFPPLWAASVLAAGAVVYGALSIVWPQRLPRLPQDLMLIGAVVLFGAAVARYQVFVERRTVMRDLPVSLLMMTGIVGVYAVLASRLSQSVLVLAGITALAIITHGAHEMVHETLERIFNRRLSEQWRRLRRVARQPHAEADLAGRLQAGLETLAQTLGARRGFVALREGEGYMVKASLHSLEVGTTLGLAEATLTDVSEPQGALAAQVNQLAPVSAGEDQVGVIGVGPRTSQAEYAEADLDLLMDVADWAGRLVAAAREQAARRSDLLDLAQSLETGEANLKEHTQDLQTTLEAQPDRQFARQVEQGLKHLADYAELGQSPLVEALGITGTTHIERGKALREHLVRAVESLRPGGAAPRPPTPPEWFAHAILHDAYVEDVPNRDIMSRLYISEGDFNRRRRRALQAVARAVYEAREK